MIITYQVGGKEKKLSLFKGVWQGGHDDLDAFLNEPFGLTSFVGRAEYYANDWQRAKAVADVLKGTLDEEEPAPGTVDPNEEQ